MLVPSAVFGNVATQILLVLWAYDAIELTVHPQKKSTKKQMQDKKQKTFLVTTGP